MRIIRKTIKYFLLVSALIITIAPFYLMIVTSFKSPQELSIYPPTLLPKSWELTNYINTIDRVPIFRYLTNSLIVSTVCAVFSLLCSILAAFAYTQYDFPGKRIFSISFMISNMLPFEITMITNYSTITKLNLTDSYAALILPFLCSFTFTLLIYSRMKAIPKPVIYAARLDGAKSSKLLFRIILPYLKNTLFFSAILIFVSSWNSFLWPLMVINKTIRRTLPFGVYVFITETGSQYQYIMACSVLSILPIIAFYLICSKFIRNQIYTLTDKG